MRVGLRGKVRRVCCRPGVNVYQRLSLVCQRLYLFLVVNAQAGNLYWYWLVSMAREQKVVAAGGLKNHAEVATVVWD